MIAGSLKPIPCLNNGVVKINDININHAAHRFCHVDSWIKRELPHQHYTLLFVIFHFVYYTRLNSLLIGLPSFCFHPPSYYLLLSFS